MKNAFQIEVLDPGPHTPCDHYSDEGVHIWGPISVRDSRMMLADLAQAVSPEKLATLLTKLLADCGITQVRLFDDEVTVTEANLRGVLLKQAKTDP